MFLQLLIVLRKIVLKEIQDKPWQYRRLNTSEWVLMDYSDIVVHVFQKKLENFTD